MTVITWNTDWKKAVKKDPLTWENKGGELTLKETSGGKGSYYISYDLGNLLHHTETQKQEEINTVILYVPQDARFSEARIQLADGDLTAEQFSCKNMTANFLDGDMILDKKACLKNLRQSLATEIWM